MFRDLTLAFHEFGEAALFLDGRDGDWDLLEAFEAEGAVAAGGAIRRAVGCVTTACHSITWLTGAAGYLLRDGGMLLDNLAMTTRSRTGLRSSSTRCLNPRVGDKQFVRRVYLDIIGRIPNCNEGNRRSGCDSHPQPHVEAFACVRREKTLSKGSTPLAGLPKIGKKCQFP